jgi:hypothetical protein
MVTECSFERNTAQWGGGIDVAIQHSARDNVVAIDASKFIENCAQTGGGAIAVGLVHAPFESHGPPPTNNRVEVTECTFEGNTALTGAGVAVRYSQTEIPDEDTREQRNVILFDNCTWVGNTAHHGAAIDVRPITKPAQTTHTLNNIMSPQVTFRDCKFKNNTAIWIGDGNIHYHGQGTVKLEMATLEIEGVLELSGGTGSAFYLKSTTVDFKSDSISTFEGNRGQHGAAIAMMGGQRSAMFVRENSCLSFRENTAEMTGGAIYQETSEDCFISRGRSVGEVTPNATAILFFNKNEGLSHIGESIFVKSLIPCMEEINTESYLEALQSIAMFDFKQNRLHEVATLGKVILNGTFPTSAIPGKRVNLNLYVLDDTNTMVETSSMIATTDTRNVTLVTGNRSIKILGKPGSVVHIAITPYHQREYQLRVNTTLSKCPPGYNHNERKGCCICSSDGQSRGFIGIQTCNQKVFRASLLYSHWAGYVKPERLDLNGSTEGEFEFRTAYCPRGFCLASNRTTKSILLPAQASEKDLSAYVCRENRVGVLCGTCVANHSAFFPRIACERDKRCSLGWLYYILSQILPVTVLFSILLAFDFSLTSGMVGGVILYMQMIDALLLTANDFLWFEPPAYKILVALRMLSRTMNLMFFAYNRFSFCLWEGATSLDILAFYYVTIIYSFLLVIFTVKVVSPLIIRLKRRFWRHAGEEVVRSQSMIHGLTSFLVLCYSRNTHTSLYILSSGSTHGQGSRGNVQVTHAFYNGELGFFDRGHLPYAIPASLMLLAITILPPLLLLMYPLCYRVLALCRIQESRFTHILCKVMPLERYKPLFDSFQGTFKDDHRYFAGLYFTYRLVWLVTLACFRELATFYIILEVELILMLLITAYVQPHKDVCHNRIDAALFALLAVINACTIYCYNKRYNFTQTSNYIQVVNTIQIALLCLPIVILAVYLAWVVVRYVKKNMQEKRGKAESSGEDISLQSMELSSRIDEEASYSSRAGYQMFADKV